MNIFNLNQILIVNIAPIIVIGSYLILFLLIALKFNLIKSFIKNQGVNWFQLGFCLFIYFLLIQFYALNINIWYTDEFEYLEIAKNLRFTGEAKYECVYNGPDNYQCASPPIAIGYSTALSLLYWIFGFNFNLAFYLSILAGAGSVILIYFIVSKMFSEKVAFYSALIYSIVPFHINWAGTAEPNVYGNFMILLSWFMIFLYSYKQSKSSLLLVVFSLVLCLYTRHEFFLATLFFLYLMIKVMKKKELFVVCVLSLILLVPNMLQAFVSTGGLSGSEYAYTPKGAVSLNNVVHNLDKWILPFGLGKSIPLIFNLFFLTGLYLLFSSFSKYKTRLIPLVLISLPFIFLCILYYMGSLSGRLLLPFLIPYCIISGYGACKILMRVNFIGSKFAFCLLIFLVISPILLHTLGYVNYFNPARFSGMKDKKIQHQFLNDFRKEKFSNNTIFLATESILYTAVSKNKFLNTYRVRRYPNLISEFKNRGYRIIFIQDISCLMKEGVVNRKKKCEKLKTLDVDEVMYFND